MDSLRIESTVRVPLIVGAVLLSGSIAGFGAVSGWGDLAHDTARAAHECRYCGVVEQVREIKSSAPRYGISTVSGGRDEMIVMLLSVLSGTPGKSDQKQIYEVSVRMDNGAIRAVRGSRLPDWKLGDRVKVVKGRVEPLS
ncbi:MAG: hypothetical protein WCA17_13380 [Burkholderiales bacterium]